MASSKGGGISLRNIRSMVDEMFSFSGVDSSDLELLVSKFLERTGLTSVIELHLPTSKQIFEDILLSYSKLRNMELALHSVCVVLPEVKDEQTSEDLDREIAYALSYELFKVGVEDDRNIEDRICDYKGFLEANVWAGNKLVLKTAIQSNLAVCLKSDPESFIDTMQNLCHEGTSQEDILSILRQQIPSFTHGMTTQDPSSTSSSAIPCSRELRMDMCFSCKKKDTKLQLCSNCKFITYCSKECQIEDWKERHKHECNLK